MVVRPEFIFVIILITLTLLITIFALLRIIFLIFRKYGINQKKVEDKDVEKEKIGNLSSSNMDRISLNEIERKWQHYIDLQFQKLRDEMIKLMDEKLGNIHGSSETNGSNGKEDTETSSEASPTYYQKEKESEADFRAGNVQATCLRIYNAAITNPEEERRFRKQYKPIRVDVVNAMQRKRDPDLEPEFQSTDSGDLFVVGLKDDNGSGGTLFIVLPRFGLTISDSNYSAGGVGDVFNCHGYDRQHVYGIRYVKSPAFFAREGHDHWNLISRGELELAWEDYED